MALLINYPAWLLKVNETLAGLSNNLFSAEDFDYPWIEAFMSNKSSEDAAKEALAEDGFIVENLPAPAMFLNGGRKCLAS